MDCAYFDLRYTRPAKKKNRAAEAVLFFLRRERCSKLGRSKHRPSCTRLRLRHTMTVIAVRRISPPCVCRPQNRHYTSIASAFLFTLICADKIRVKISVNRYRSRFFCFYISKKYELWCRFVFLFTKLLQTSE